MNIHRDARILSSLGAFALSALMFPAMAQEGPADAAAVAPQAGDEATDAQIRDIVVTARRRDETLQQTPIAITAISPAQLESKASINIGDLQGAAPNVLITNQNSGAAAANVSIRGLTFADVEKSFEPTVGVVVDGVFIGTSTGQFFDFFDISQIEVLRGPQGTLFGRNTIGGVINIRRTRPTGEFGGKFEFSYGNYDTWAGRAVVNVPIIDGVLAAKAFYFHNQSDGYYRNGITGRRVGASNNENFGASFLLTPSSNFDALLTLEKQVQDFDPVNSNISQTGEVFCAFEPADQCNRNTTTDLYTVFNSPAHSNYKAPAATLEMNLDLGGVKLTSITGYREAKEAQTQDFDASSSDLYYVNRVQSFHQFSQELRAAGKISDGFDYVVGAFFYDSKYNLVQETQIFGAPAPTQDVTGTSQSYAFFGDFNLQLMDQVRLSFGGRWTHDKKTNENFVAPDQFPKAGYSGSKFTPKIGLDYRPSDDLMLYASWSRGYRSGGLSGRGQTLISSTTPYGPETVDSYEVGLKSSFFDKKMLFNIAGFYSDYQSLQQNTTIPISGGIGNETVVTNVGSATIKGIEAELTAKPVPGLTLTGSLGLLRSKFKGFITQAPVGGVLTTFDYSANNLIYNPRETFSVTADYTVPVGFGEAKFNVSYRNIAPYDQQISLGPTTVDANGVVIVNGNDPRVRSDRQGLLDASASLVFDLNGHKARITAYGRNLADDRGPTAAFTVAGLFSFASAREPRSYGLQLGFEF
ncbi:TonB-dependent receptor [Sphingobium phenoxybenzoativorans]|uniref:TonB-dependent receptor n=1 Tax=Sphingobium phenoxybenzoativorans TaxID=1592790 RepID=A0A975K3C0_9SPHN|nr:TonB-dependent receptor [Sphingobium phenoxybenzoativorans]QUT04140.1 TonB-dependent receptor [Sphingobium phenoxybenzoativorans]